jgi:hypothetical protein
MATALVEKRGGKSSSRGRDLANNLATPRLSRDRQNGFPS